MDIVTIFVTIVPVIFIVPHLIFANRLGDKTPDSHEGGDSIYVPMKVLPTFKPMHCQSQINLYDWQKKTRRSG